MLSLYLYHTILTITVKKVNRKVQRVPQSQTAAKPRYQEEEKNDKTNTFKTNKCTRSTQKSQTSSLFPKRDDDNA